MLFNMVLPGAVETARLPKEYQEVEYIQSSGTQYIDTGVVATSGFEVEIKIAITSYSAGMSGTWAPLLGAHELSDPYKRNFVACKSDGSIEVDAGNKITTTAVSFSGNGTIKASNVANNYYLNVNGTNYTPTLVQNDSAPAYSSRTLHLLHCNGYDLGYTAGRLYYCKIYTGGNLVRDYVPCYRKADLAIGVYDLADGAFYSNAGTGYFTAGPDVGGTPSTGDTVDFTYSGNYSDNRVNGKGTVRLNTSGTLTVLSGKATVSVYILGAGGGGAYNGNTTYGSASGGSGGYQTVTVELIPGTYDIVIGTGGNRIYQFANAASLTANDGGDTTAFGFTSTGGKGGRSGLAGMTAAPYGGAGGTPNGNSGTTANPSALIPGGSPNGGASDSSGGDGYVELTFI